MQIKKIDFIKALSVGIVCPSDLGIEVSKEGKICGYSVDCKRCWNEAVEDINNIELIGGIEECRK